MKNEKPLEAPAQWVIHIMRALKWEVKGKVPLSRVQMCRKSPLGQHLLGQFGNYTQSLLNCESFALSYLEVPSIIVVEGHEKRLWLGDVCIPKIPETNIKLCYWKPKPHLCMRLETILNTEQFFWQALNVGQKNIIIMKFSGGAEIRWPSSHIIMI